MPTQTTQRHPAHLVPVTLVNQDAALPDSAVNNEAYLSAHKNLIEYFEMTEEQAGMQLALVLKRLEGRDFNTQMDYLYTELTSLKNEPFNLNNKQLLDLNTHVDSDNIYRLLISYIDRFTSLLKKGICTNSVTTFAISHDDDNDDNLELLLSNIEQLLSSKFATPEQINTLLKHGQCCKIFSFVLDNFPKLTSDQINMSGEPLCLIAVKRNRETLEIHERMNTLLTLKSLLNNFEKLLELGLSREQIFSIARYDYGYISINAAIKFIPKFVNGEVVNDVAIASNRKFTLDQVYSILANTDSTGGGMILNALYDHATTLFRLKMSSADMVKLCGKDGGNKRFETIIKYYDQLTSKAAGTQHIPPINNSHILDMALSYTMTGNKIPTLESRVKVFLEHREALVGFGYSIDQIVKMTIADHEILPVLVGKHPNLSTHSFTHDDIVLLSLRKKGMSNLEFLSDKYEELRVIHHLSHEMIVDVIRDKKVADIALALKKKVPLLCTDDAAPAVDDTLQMENALLERFGFNTISDITRLRKDSPDVGGFIIAIELAKRFNMENFPSHIPANIDLSPDQLKPFFSKLQLLGKELGYPIGKLQNIIKSLNLSAAEQVQILKQVDGLKTLKTLIQYTLELLSCDGQQKFSKDELLLIASSPVTAKHNIMELGKNILRLLAASDQPNDLQQRFTSAQLTLISSKNSGYLAIRYVLAHHKELFNILKTTQNIIEVMRLPCWRAIVTDIMQHQNQLRRLGINAAEIIDIAAFQGYEKNICLLVEHFKTIDELLKSIHASAQTRKQKILAMLRHSSAKDRLDAFLSAREKNPQQDAIISKQEHHIANRTIDSGPDEVTQASPSHATTRRGRENTNEIDNFAAEAAPKKVKKTPNSVISVANRSTGIPQQVKSVELFSSSSSTIPHNDAASSIQLAHYNFTEIAEAARIDEETYKAHYSCLINEYQQTHEEAIDWLSQDVFFENMEQLSEYVDRLTSSPINLTKAQVLSIMFLPNKRNILPDILDNLAGLHKLEQLGIKTAAFIMAILEERDRYDIFTVLLQIDDLLNKFNFIGEDINQLLTAKTFDKKIPISTMKDIYAKLSEANNVLRNFTANQIVRVIVRSGERAKTNLEKLIQCYDELIFLGFDHNQIIKIAASTHGDKNIRAVIGFSGKLVGHQGSEDRPEEPGLGFTHDDICAIVISKIGLTLGYIEKNAEILLESQFSKDDIVRKLYLPGSKEILNAVLEKMGNLKAFATPEQIVRFIRKCSGTGKKCVDDLLELKNKLENLGLSETQIKLLAHHEDMYACFEAVVRLFSKLQALEFNSDDIVLIASHKNPEENLTYVAMNYHDLCKRHGINRRQFMSAIEINPNKDVEDAIDGSYECPTVKQLLLSHGFTQQQLDYLNKYDKRSCKLIARYLQPLLFQADLPNGDHGLKLEISQLIALAGVPCGSYNILAVMQYHQELLNSGKFSIENVLQIASWFHGSNNLQKTLELHNELLDIGFTPAQIVKIVSREKGDEVLHYLHENLSTLMKIFLTMDEMTTLMCKKTYHAIQAIVNNSDLLAKYFSSKQILQLAEGLKAGENVEKLVANIERLHTLLQDRPIDERKTFIVDLACGPNGANKIDEFLLKKTENPNYNPSFFACKKRAQRMILKASVDSAVPRFHIETANSTNSQSIV